METRPVSLSVATVVASISLSAEMVANSKRSPYVDASFKNDLKSHVESEHFYLNPLIILEYASEIMHFLLE